MALSASGKATTSKSKDLITQFEEELAKNPNNAKAHFLLASALLNAGRESDAIFHFSETVRLDDSNYIAMNNLAWIRASHPDPKLRDGAEAIRWAKRACELTEYKVFICVDTLAIAYAEAQQFTEAISIGEKALELAKSTNQKAVADEIQGHLVLFRAGKPFREAAPSAAPPVSER
jgi:serine/threonine-protein kinase